MRKSVLALALAMVPLLVGAAGKETGKELLIVYSSDERSETFPCG